MVDAGRFLIILFIFLFGFSIHVAALNQPFHERDTTVILPRLATSGLPSGGMNLSINFEFPHLNCCNLGYLSFEKKRKEKK